MTDGKLSGSELLRQRVHCNMLNYRNRLLSPEIRAADLLKRMSVEEKVGQLCKGRAFSYYTRVGETVELHRHFVDFMTKRPLGTLYGTLRADWWTERDFESGIPAKMARQTRNLFQKTAVEGTRLGIPFFFVEEAPHGLVALDASVFPTGLGLGATFDSELLEKIGRAIGDEGFSAGVHSIYAPVLDIAADPRWSRCEECFSEEARHCAILAAAMVRGIRAAGVEPTLKHYVGGGHCEGGHNTLTAHIGPYELFIDSAIK